MGNSARERRPRSCRPGEGLAIVSRETEASQTETKATWRDAASAHTLRALFAVLHADVDIAPRTRLEGYHGYPALNAALRPPIVRRWAVALLSSGTKLVIETFDQPGRWMPDQQLQTLHSSLRDVARQSMADKIPTHYLFQSDSARTALSNRVVSIVYVEGSRAPVAFTAMVYLPFNGDVFLHLGLTMISTEFRGRRLQSRLMARCLTVALLNSRRIQYTVTNIAGSPAGIGACCDYFLDVYPNYNFPDSLPSAYHQSVARHALRNFRHEFACSAKAFFDDVKFVVHCSNNPAGGGAPEFIKADGSPVSQYKRSECNAFCARSLDLRCGDELFQVGRANIILSWLKYLFSPTHSG